MKGKYFSGTVLKKDVTRFAPIWGLYTIFMLLFLFFIWDVERDRFATNAPFIMQMMGMVNLVYAGLSAILLFGDLFQSRMCNALHAMPLRREGWFLTHLTAGMLFCIVPNLLGALLASVVMNQLSFLAYVWLGQVILTYLFFFGVAVFSCLCAGNRIGAIAVYTIINFFAVVVTFLVQTLYIPLLWGVQLDLYDYYSLSPVVAFTQSNFVEIKYEHITQVVSFVGYETFAWLYLFVAAAVGAVLLGLSVLLYRKRDLESAGDFISWKPVAPVFLVLFSLCAGTVLYFIAESIGSGAQLLFLVIGLIIGYFTGQMLLSRRVNVFNKKTICQFAILAAALLLSLAVTRLDPVGVTRYVPEAKVVAQVKISPYSSWTFRGGDQNIVLTELEDVEEITRMHREIIQMRPGADGMVVNMQYTLKSGQKVNRMYYVYPDSGWGKTLKGYYSAPECVFGTEDIDKMLENMVMIEGWPYTNQNGLPYVSMVLKNSQQEAHFGEMELKVDEGEKVFTLLTENRFNKEPVARGLIEAMKKDCAESNMAQVWDYHSNEDEIGYLSFEYYVEEGDYGELNRQTVNIFTGCTNTIAYLKSLVTE